MDYCDVGVSGGEDYFGWMYAVIVRLVRTRSQVKILKKFEETNHLIFFSSVTICKNVFLVYGN